MKRFGRHRKDNINSSFERNCERFKNIKKYAENRGITEYGTPMCVVRAALCDKDEDIIQSYIEDIKIKRLKVDAAEDVFTATGDIPATKEAMSPNKTENINMSVNKTAELNTSAIFTSNENSAIDDGLVLHNLITDQKNTMSVCSDLLISTSLCKSGQHAINFLNSSVITTPISSVSESKSVCEFTMREYEQFLHIFCLPFTEMPRNPKKVAEASFSEVFLVAGKIHKIIPFTEHYEKRSFYKEVSIMKILSRERGVCKFSSAFILQGEYSPEYIAAWEAFPKSENAHPGAYSRHQAYGCIVMEDCGRDLESYEFAEHRQIFVFLKDLVEIIVRLERKYRFEHRDMHWGNILINNGRINLIDFSLSRLQSTVLIGDRIANRMIYTEMEPWIFEGDGDVDYQFVVYRKMRTSTGDDWRGFCPENNLHWVVYVIRKLVLKSDGLGDEKAREETKSALNELLPLSSLYEMAQKLKGILENDV